MHAVINPESEMITSLLVTGGNGRDGKQISTLAQKDREQKLPTDTYAADHGYGECENHQSLLTLGLHSAIVLNRYRTEKKDRNKQG